MWSLAETEQSVSTGGRLRDWGLKIFHELRGGRAQKTSGGKKKERQYPSHLIAACGEIRKNRAGGYKPLRTKTGSEIQSVYLVVPYYQKETIY